MELVKITPNLSIEVKDEILKMSDELLRIGKDYPIIDLLNKMGYINNVDSSSRHKKRTDFDLYVIIEDKIEGIIGVEHYRNNTWVGWFIVIDKFKGIGSRAIKELFKQYPNMYVASYNDKKSIEFYKKNGFKEIDFAHNFLKNYPDVADKKFSNR